MTGQDAKRRQLERLGRIRELIFGMQDGLLATLGFVAGLYGATGDNRLVLLAGLVEMAAGAMSMGAAEFLSAKARRQVYAKAVREEQRRFEQEPYLAHQDLLHALTDEGVSKAQAYRIVKLLKEERGAFFKTFQAKVMGLGAMEAGDGLAGALIMGGSYATGALLVLLPFMFLAGPPAVAGSISVAITALFGLGVLKGRLAALPVWRSGLEVLLIAAGAAVAGYVFGLLLPEH